MVCALRSAEDRLGLLRDVVAGTDSITKPWVIEAGVQVADQPFRAVGNLATAGGCLASYYLATWILVRTAGDRCALADAPGDGSRAAGRHRLRSCYRRIVIWSNAWIQETIMNAELPSGVDDARGGTARTSGPSTVLFLGANPQRLPRLQLDEECRAIEEKIRAGSYRDRLRFRSRWAARPDDLLQALNEDNPSVLHFSGHGAGEQGLCFHADDGSTLTVRAEVFARVLRAAGESVVVVLLNACFSEVQAQALSAHIPCVIGMPAAIGDDAAIAYAAGFYRALAFGKSVANAHEQGLAALALSPGDGPNRDAFVSGGDSEQCIPRLLTRADSNPHHIYVVSDAGRRARGTIFIEATIKDFTPEVLARVTEELRRHTSDFTLRVVSVEEGSVRLTVEMSELAAKVLAEMRDSGQLTQLCGFAVMDVIAEPPASDTRAPDEDHGIERDVADTAATRQWTEADQIGVRDADEDLMARYQGGEVRAFEVLLSRHRKPVYNSILRLVGDRDDAEDLLQEVFMRVIKGAEAYRQQSNFTTWIYRIARNLCVEQMKRKHRKPSPLDAPVHGGDESSTLPDVMPTNEIADDRTSVTVQPPQTMQRAIEALAEDRRNWEVDLNNLDS